MKCLVVALLLCGFTTVAVTQEGLPTRPVPSTPQIAEDPSPSNQPPPTPRELPRPDHESAKSSEKAAAHDQRGTENEPFSVKLIPGEKTEAEARKERYETEEKPALDRGLTSYTGWLVIFTGLLFLAASIQAGLFVWQLLLIRRSLADSKQAADAAKLATDQSREFFITEQRPWIGIEVIPRGDFYLSEKHKKISIDIVLTNFGKTPAYDVFYYMLFFMSGPNKSELPGGDLKSCVIKLSKCVTKLMILSGAKRYFQENPCLAARMLIGTTSKKKNSLLVIEVV